MGKEKLKNLFLILIGILIIIGIPYALYSLGKYIEIDYFGYINNWWVVLLFILILISVFVLAGINLDKNMGYLFLILFTIPFFILGINFGIKSALDLESYNLLMEKELEIDYLDSVRLQLESDFVQLEDDNTSQNPNFKNHEIIFFDPGSSEISEFNQLKINAFISDLESCVLNIKGYTDGSGNKSSNMDISNERAHNVADFIKSINQQNITINTVTGFGDNDQLVANRNEMSRSKNRRVTIEIVGKIDQVIKSNRKKIRDEINKNREDVKNIKLERDSLRKIFYLNVEE